MFENILKSLLEAQEERKNITSFYIKNGFCESWAAENKIASDEGIKRYSTPAKWDLYTAGKITREDAVKKAIERNNKKVDKETAAKIARLETIAAAPDLNYISINVEWKKSSVWGHNPHAEARDNKGIYTYGTASGCGYDKESSAVASALNANNSILKILYTIKENALKDGKTDKDKTACTNRDNRDCCGYGAGYSAMPYFEGGVGVNCFWAILKKAGFQVNTNWHTHNTYYYIDKEA